MDQLPRKGEMRSFAGGDGLQICVASVESEGAVQTVAFNNRCPHQGAPLSAGHLEGCMVVCPYHAWRFDAVTGTSENLTDPDLQMYELRQHGNEVFVRLPQRAAGG